MISPVAPAETAIFHDAIRHWWKSKSLPKGRKKSQGGTRDANLHGKTMDGFAETLRDYLIGLGVRREHIYLGGQLTAAPAILPSCFRPSKNWDLVVIARSRFHRLQGETGDPVLHAAVEFKSQDKSIGNNQNNRLEESLGNAHDFWATYEKQGFERMLPRPWLGYLFVGNYTPDKDDKPVKVRQPHFQATVPFRRPGSESLESFPGPSYAERYQLFLRQSIGTRLYNAGAFLVTDESIAQANPNHRILVPEFGPANFLRSLKAQILSTYTED